MKPCSRKALHSSNLLQQFGFGSKNTVASALTLQQHARRHLPSAK